MTPVATGSTCAKPMSIAQVRLLEHLNKELACLDKILKGERTRAYRYKPARSTELNAFFLAFLSRKRGRSIELESW